MTRSSSANLGNDDIDSFLFLFLSMIIIAASLYLPEHIATVLSRAWFYYAGDETSHTSAGGPGPGGSNPGDTGRSGLEGGELLNR